MVEGGERRGRGTGKHTHPMRQGRARKRSEDTHRKEGSRCGHTAPMGRRDQWALAARPSRSSPVRLTAQGAGRHSTRRQGEPAWQAAAGGAGHERAEPRDLQPLAHRADLAQAIHPEPAQALRERLRQVEQGRGPLAAHRATGEAQEQNRGGREEAQKRVADAPQDGPESTTVQKAKDCETPMVERPRVQEGNHGLVKSL